MPINKTDISYLNLAFEKARLNLGNTGDNPSVGCVITKNGAVISSASTEYKKGRPHAEFKALMKKINFKNSTLYSTLEPCSHYGETPPCTNLIISKKIKKVIYPLLDYDKRVFGKTQKILKRKNIQVGIFKKYKKAKDFYQSYYLKKIKCLPLLDARIAISKDLFTIDKKNKNITNFQSRTLSQYFRTNYSHLLTTSKTLNKDNPIMNCRILGLKDMSPDIIIIDRFFRIKKNLKIFNENRKRTFYLIITRNNQKKYKYFSKIKNLKIIKISKLESKNDFENLLKLFYHKGFNRIIVETGITLINLLRKYKLINNMYVYQSNRLLSINGLNKINNLHLKNQKKINIYLYGDKVFKLKLKNYV